MSLENMNLSEEVASLADLLPGSPDQMILPDMNPGPGKILLTGSSNHLMLPKGKKLITKDKAVVVAPTVAEVTDDYKMDFDLLDTAFEQVKIEPAQEQQFNEMMMLAEYDVPVIHIAEPENNTNQVWSANSLFGENTGLSSNPNHFMMATVNPYEAEGLVSVAGAIPADIPEQAPEDQQDNANADDLLKFVMDETIGADIETFNTHFNITEEVSATINFDDLFEPQPSTSTANIKTEVKTEVTEDYDDDGDEDYVPVPAKRPRGRPRLPRAEIPPPRRPRGRPATALPYADVSDIDLE